MDSMIAYSQSKLAIIIWSQEMARKHPSGPAFISINPGSLLATKMVKEGFGIEGKNINIGADILVKAATDKTFLSYSGKYYDNDIRKFSLPHQLASDQLFCNYFQALFAIYPSIFYQRSIAPYNWFHNQRLLEQNPKYLNLHSKVYFFLS